MAKIASACWTVFLSANAALSDYKMYKAASEEGSTYLMEEMENPRMMDSCNTIDPSYSNTNNIFGLLHHNIILLCTHAILGPFMAVIRFMILTDVNMFKSLYTHKILHGHGRGHGVFILATHPKGK